MLKFSSAFVAACIVCALPAIAIAADDKPMPEHHMMHAHKPKTRDEVIAKTKEMFAKLDLNHDGFITPDEIKAARDAKMAEMKKRRFDALDTNHDGIISRDEFLAAMPPQREHGPDVDGHPHPWMRAAMMRHRPHDMHRMFEMADANHDGKMSLDEVLAFRLARFDKIDTNRDGVISPEEMKAFHASAHHM
jgi:Ca2+-binding EF-hand superfamily protein